MKYKREETFRYEFESELKCLFKIINIDGVQYDSNMSEGLLIDLSPSGLRIFSPLAIPVEKKIVLYVEFTINKDPIKLSADILWKRDVGNGFHYGLKHRGEETDTRLLIDELKLYAKNNQKHS